MDNPEQEEIHVQYMVYLLQKKFGKEFEYDKKLATDAKKHSEYMAQEEKIMAAPEKFLYSDELVSSITVPNKHIKIGMLNLINKIFKYESNKEKMKNSSKIGIGVSSKKKNNNNNTQLFVTKRMM